MILFAWIVLGIGFLGFVFVFVAKIPVISDRVVGRMRVLMITDSFFGYIKRKLKIVLEKLWHFILEAKDLKPPLPINRLMHIGQMNLPSTAKKAFRIRIRQSEAEPAWLPEAAELAPRQTTVDIEHQYLEAIKRHPEDVAAYEGLARLYLQEKNFAEAAETFDYLTNLDPTRDVYWSNLGLALFSIKQFKQACQAYQKALDLNNKIPVRWINLALCLDNLDEPTKAVKAITQALQLDPRNVNYQFLMADMYMKSWNKFCKLIRPTNPPEKN
jgi:tetratricopeptide (TPR) repeat protein